MDFLLNNLLSLVQIVLDLYFRMKEKNTPPIHVTNNFRNEIHLHQPITYGAYDKYYYLVNS